MEIKETKSEVKIENEYKENNEKRRKEKKTYTDTLVTKLFVRSYISTYFLPRHTYIHTFKLHI